MKKLLKITAIILVQALLLMPAYCPARDNSDTLAPELIIKAEEFKSAVLTGYKAGAEKREGFYEEVAANGWGENSNFSLWGAMPELVLYLTQRLKGKKILSCGIGLAEMEQRLNLNNDVTCIDNVPGLVNRAREKGLNAFLGDANDLSGFADNQFDLVIFPFSIAHVKNVTAVCEQVRRILKENGELLIISQSPANRNTVAHCKLYGYTLYPIDRLKKYVKEAELFVTYVSDKLVLTGSNGPKKISVNYILATKDKVDKNNVNRTLIPSYGNNDYAEDDFFASAEKKGAGAVFQDYPPVEKGVMQDFSIPQKSGSSSAVTRFFSAAGLWGINLKELNIVNDSSGSLLELIAIGITAVIAVYSLRMVINLLQNIKNSRLLKKFNKKGDQDFITLSDFSVEMNAEELREGVRQVREVWHGKRHPLIERDMVPFFNRLGLEAKTIKILSRNIDRLLDNSVNSVADSKGFPHSGRVSVSASRMMNRKSGELYLKIEVIDNGAGIEAAKLKKLFKKRSDIDSRGSKLSDPQKGRKEYARMKLGSYTAALYWTGREIVRELGGFIRVQTNHKGKNFVLNYLGLKPKIVSRENVQGDQQGTTFAIYLPMGKAVDLRKRDFLKTANPVRLAALYLAAGAGTAAVLYIINYLVRLDRRFILAKEEMIVNLLKFAGYIELIEKSSPDKIAELTQELRKKYPQLPLVKTILFWPSQPEYWRINQKSQDKEEEMRRAKFYDNTAKMVISKYYNFYRKDFIFDYQLLIVICCALNNENWEELLRVFISNNRNNPDVIMQKNHGPLMTQAQLDLPNLAAGAAVVSAITPVRLSEKASFPDKREQSSDYKGKKRDKDENSPVVIEGEKVDQAQELFRIWQSGQLLEQAI